MLRDPPASDRREAAARSRNEQEKAGKDSSVEARGGKGRRERDTPSSAPCCPFHQRCQPMSTPTTRRKAGKTSSVERVLLSFPSAVSSNPNTDDEKEGGRNCFRRAVTLSLTLSILA
jgi:hypothetical protein